MINSALLRARVHAYPVPLFAIAALLLLAPVLHVSEDAYTSSDVSALPFLGPYTDSTVGEAYWLAAVVVAALYAFLHYAKRDVRLRALPYTLGGAVVAYVLVAVLPGAVWHWNHLALMGLAAVAWAMVAAERSLWLGVVAGGFTTVSVLAGVSGNSFRQWLGLIDDQRSELGVLLPSILVLLVGGLIGVLLRGAATKAPADENALVLLTDLARLRKPADARRYAPPLLLFGVLIIAAAAVYRPLVITNYRVPFDFESDVVYRFGSGDSSGNPWVLDAYWLGALVVGIGATMWWYHSRAARLGVELDTRGQLVAAGAVLVGIIVGVPAVWAVLGEEHSPKLGPYLHAWLLIISTVLAAAVLFHATRPTRRPVAHAVELVAGWLVAAFAAAMLALYLEYAVLAVFAAVVIAMAWVERSWWLRVVAAAFAVSVLLVTITRNSLFDHVGWNVDGHPRLNVLQDLLLPSAVLVVGGLAGLIGTTVRHKPSATTVEHPVGV